MTAGDALERRYRRLLAWYPASHRRAYGEEMIGVLLASAPEGAGRPGLGDSLDLVRVGIGARFRSGWRTMTDIDWPDALAVTSVAVPVILLGYYVANRLNGSPVPIRTQAAEGLAALIFAAPPVLAWWFRRVAGFVVAAMAGLIAASFVISLYPHWGWASWRVSGQVAGAWLAIVVGAAALALSGGPRRATQILTARSWLVLAASGVATGLLDPFLWSHPAWLGAVITVAAFAVIAAGLLLTLPGPVARGLLVLLAIPACPAAVWVVYDNWSQLLLDIALLPAMLSAGVAAAGVSRGRQRGAE